MRLQSLPILTSDSFLMILIFIILKPYLKSPLLWEVLPDYSSPQGSSLFLCTGCFVFVVQYHHVPCAWPTSVLPAPDLIPGKRRETFGKCLLQPA